MKRLRDACERWWLSSFDVGLYPSLLRLYRPAVRNQVLGPVPSGPGLVKQSQVDIVTCRVSKESFFYVLFSLVVNVRVDSESSASGTKIPQAALCCGGHHKSVTIKISG